MAAPAVDTVADTAADTVVDTAADTVATAGALVPSSPATRSSSTADPGKFFFRPAGLLDKVRIWDLGFDGGLSQNGQVYYNFKLQ